MIRKRTTRKGNNLPTLFLCLCAGSLVLFQGCGTLPNGRGWGQDATLTPGWDRVKRSAVDAAVSPETWVPVAASLALQVDNIDKRISDWASDNNPVFGSRNNAGRWTEYIFASSIASYFFTAMAAPSGEEPADWSIAKAKGLAVGVTSWCIPSGAVYLLKRVSDRMRPDGSNNRSLPSDHASASGAFTTLARRNLEYFSLSQGGRIFANIGIAGMAAGTAWARVEAKKHYLSDVLLGYALGHFFSAFINDAFLGLDRESAARLTVEPYGKGMIIGLSWAY
jgi:hypothetical protein